MEKRFPNGKVLRLAQGDITKYEADAIANAANSRLAGGGGVDGAIHRAGGPAIMRELDEIRSRTGDCPTGGAVATTAGRLPAKYVFHAVGPVYRDGRHGEPEALRSCYDTCMKLAAKHSADSIAFPSISTGVYGYPVEDAARIAVDTVAGHLKAGESAPSAAAFVLFDAVTFDAYSQALGNL